jgi:hypothetical protein
MAALDFPISPANNQIYSLNGVQYYYNGVIGAWLTNLITNPINANTTNTQILYNDAGYTNGSIGLVFNKYSNTFSTGSIAASSNVTGNNIFSTGSIGVGTTVPVTILDVVSNVPNFSASPSVLDRSTVRILNNSVAGLGVSSKLNFSIANIGSSIISGYYAAFNGSNDIGTGFTFATQNNAAVGTVERMRITQAGNVGIGNTAPTLKLEVAGNMSVDAFVEYSSVITTSYTITAGRNAMSAGPITLNTGVSVTIPTGSVWTIM